MWERAVGIPETNCLPQRARLTARGLGRIRLGAGDLALLRSAGQPLTRTRAWTYCVGGASGGPGKKHKKKKASAARRKGKKKKRASSSGGTTAVLTPQGQVALIATTAKGHRVRGIHPGEPASVLRGHARRKGKGLWVSKLHKTRVAYVVKGKRVNTVAIAGPAARSRKALRGYLALIPSKGFEPRGSLVLAKHTRKKLASRAPLSLVQAHERGRKPFYCSIGL
jgi:hypothetical protein